MAEKLATASQIYAKGIKNLKKGGFDWKYPPQGRAGLALNANRRYLNSLFFETKFFDPQEADTSLKLFGVKLKTPVFCSALSRRNYMPESSLAEIAAGIGAAGSFIILGIGGYAELQGAIDTGAPVVKMIKPYRNTDLMFENAREARLRGCVAAGMDIDHFYGRLGVDGDVSLTDLFAPQMTAEIKQVMAESRLPFIIKGVLSLTDAEKAYKLGAEAIVVSNHGCFSLESSLPSMIALPQIAKKYGNKMTILVDSGFETGNDALKAIALGADGVGYGSSMVLAWAAAGAYGVAHLVKQMTAEIRRTMSVTGCGKLSDVNPSILREIPGQPAASAGLSEEPEHRLPQLSPKLMLE